MNNARNLVALTLGVLLMATATWSEVPEKMNYQVMLTDNSDQPLANESVQLVFSIYNVDAGGASLWTETHDVVTNSIGVVSAVLGTYNPLSLGFEGPLWLQVAVDGEIMSPRRELTSAPYALSVGAGVSGDGHSLDADDGSPVDAVYVDSDGTVGFGSSTSDGKAEFYTAGGENPSIKLSAGPTYGGLIELYEESGAQYGGLEPDFDGTGGFLWIDNGSGWSGFYVDGNAVSGNAQVGIFGTASSTYFSTYSTGNDAVLLPMNAVSGLEILDEPGAASAAHSGLYYLTGSIDALASSAITTPAAGYVLAIATASVVVNHTGGAISSCTFGVSST
ncbi:hypothetical protein KAW64_08385, partial [bacterium]|nr:hypothetical protein [bacterium]